MASERRCHVCDVSVADMRRHERTTRHLARVAARESSAETDVITEIEELHADKE